MTYQCPKGHQSADSDYCSECGALIGQSKIINVEPIPNSNPTSSPSKEICPDCGTPREGDARFCEVCRHDFLENKTGVAETIVESQQSAKQNSKPVSTPVDNPVVEKAPVIKKDTLVEKEAVVSEKLNVIISVDQDRATSSDVESSIKPDTKERVFPLDLDENLVGRRSQNKGIYPEIEINDPGVSHRHLKFIVQPDGGFAVLELGSANGTELNGAILESGITTPVKAGDELMIGIWTRLKIVSR